MSRGSTWWAARCATALLGRTPKELDFVVEGDGIAVARRAAEKLDAALTVHERFGTATVRTPTDAFDIASARTETYERPGALPTVQLGATIEQDLARRDFTINAMAIGLDGREVEWPGAQDDLRARLLRVLHDRSFIDDPTRMLRLVRYAERLGFAPDPHTATLVDHALLATITQDRVNREIRLLLAEAPRCWPSTAPCRTRPRSLPRWSSTPIPTSRTWTCGGSCAASARR